ncbi:MAG: D-alanine--D-alanine ligase [Firmicutes bacterium]|nr:D-alanine--D-alanine ligase [Bacillota bacterium]
MRLAVICGGRSGEHDVSLMSARSVVQALDRNRYEIAVLWIDREGGWYLLPGPDHLPGPGEKTDPGGKAEKGKTGNVRPAAILPDPGRPGIHLLAGSGTLTGSGESLEPPGVEDRTLAVDVAFPVLHGPYGEDGTVQGLLELAGIPFVGAGVAGSAAGMDKGIMKALFREAGLPVVDYRLYTRRDWERDPAGISREVETALGYPVFVKPANLGSSVGVSKAGDHAGLAEAFRRAARHDRRIMVEKGIPVRELECAVLGNDEPAASVVGEIIPCADFYDYEAKYADDRTRLVVPAEVPPGISDQLRDLAVRAFKSVDCAGMGRVDFFLHRDTGAVYVNEINTIPGFTKVSMYPRLWEATGLPYPRLLDRLVELALERHAERPGE